MKMKYPVEIIRSDRRTLSLEIKSDGRIIARAPRRMKESDIRLFIDSKSSWIEKHLGKIRTAQKRLGFTEKLTEEQVEELVKKANAYIPERVGYYAEILGVSYNKVSCKPLRSKWGSCSSKGNLSFNCLLMLTPAEVIDSIVVHELCHRLEMNHSGRFYSHVLKAYPDYYRWHGWLRQNGSALIKQLPDK